MKLFYLGLIGFIVAWVCAAIVVITYITGVIT